MKHTLLSLLIAITSITAAGAVGPTRTVLYTCGPNEEYDCLEYHSNMKITGNRFSCITRDKSTSRLSLVLNGAKIVTAKYLWVYWIDVNAKERCVYHHTDNDDEIYLYVDGVDNGPYESYYYVNQIACSHDYEGVPNLNLMYNKGLFYFQRMGRVYRHDNDGTIYSCEGDSPYSAKETDPVYHSADGVHKAQFTNNYKRLILNGRTFNTPIDASAENASIYQMCITDEGNCVARIGYKTAGGWTSSNFAILNGTMRKMTDEEYYDPYSASIRKKDSSLPTKIIQQMDPILRWDSDAQEHVNGIDITLYDKTNRHIFTANWKYDYIMIDDKKLGNSTPINAFYDSSANAFGWVTIEGRNLVLYSYKL